MEDTLTKFEEICLNEFNFQNEIYTRTLNELEIMKSLKAPFINLEIEPDSLEVVYYPHNKRLEKFDVNFYIGLRLNQNSNLQSGADLLNQKGILYYCDLVIETFKKYYSIDNYWSMCSVIGQGSFELESENNNVKGRYISFQIQKRK